MSGISIVLKMKNSIENWKSVKGFEGRYEISTLGRVHSIPRIDSSGKRTQGGMLTPEVTRNGYERVTLRSSNKKSCRMSVHRLVAQTFIPNVENKPTVNHKDGNKRNNSVSNLEWNTFSENLHHASKAGLKLPLRGDFHQNSKLTTETVKQARVMREQGATVKAIAQQFGVSRQTMGEMLQGDTWKHV